jgi:hypothetical protein
MKEEPISWNLLKLSGMTVKSRLKISSAQVIVCTLDEGKWRIVHTGICFPSLGRFGTEYETLLCGIATCNYLSNNLFFFFFFSNLKEEKKTIVWPICPSVPDSKNGF